MGGFGGLLMQSRLRRLLQQNPQETPELPSDTSDTTDEADLLELFRDPASLGRLKEHIMNQPRREDFQPSGLDRGIAALSSALDNRPHDRVGRIQGMLDKPYDQAVEQYNQEGRGLSGVVAAEEGSLNRQRLGRQAVDNLRERKRSSSENSELRRQAAEDRAEQIRQQLEDKDLDRASRERLEKMQDDTRREIAQLSRDNALAIAAMKDNNGEGGRKSNLQPEVDTQGTFTGRAFDPRAGSVVDISDAKGMRTKPLAAAENTRRGALQQMISEADKALGLVDTVGSSKIGPIDAPIERFKQKTIGSDADTEELYRSIGEGLVRRIYTESGKAITEKEFERLKTVMPTPDLPFETLKRRLAATRAMFQEFLTNTSSDTSLGGGGKEPRRKRLKSGIEVTIEDD